MMTEFSVSVPHTNLLHGFRTLDSSALFVKFAAPDALQLHGKEQLYIYKKIKNLLSCSTRIKNSYMFGTSFKCLAQLFL